MGWNNPDVPWAELERRLSGRPAPDGGDAPGWSRKRRKTGPREIEGPDGPVVPYAELHCHTHFSFLDGASGPDALVEEAIGLGLDGLAITDHDGFYGAPRFAEEAAKYPEHDLQTVYGAELSLGLRTPQNGVADPEGSHLLVLARGVEGYHRLAAAITDAQLRGDEKGRPLYDLDELADRGRDHWVVLTGCRKGHVRQALAAGGRPAAAEALDVLTQRFGIDGVGVELIDHGFPVDSAANDALADLARDHGLATVATNNVHFAQPAQGRLAAATAAVRARRSLADMDGWLPATGAAHLRSGVEMQQLFRRYPGAVARTVPLAHELAFDLRAATPQLPKRGIPDGHTAMSWLRVLAERGIQKRYAHNQTAARERIERELAVIEEKDFPGYFLIVHDIVKFARSQGILCQGRGSSANSALCYALEITAIDSIFFNLPFERFLATTREEEPDIDVDFDSDRREEVIQWVYDTYGRRNAAQVANVISYRPRSAIRDAAKALGHSVGQQDAWSKQIDGWGPLGSEDVEGVPAPVTSLARQMMTAPRHLGIHSGGMILTERPIGEVCPIERGRMDKRTVLQWDKDACEFMGLVKFDLLGLGMLGALDHTMRIVAEHLDEHWDLDSMPKEEAGVYDMLCRADSIGVFQVESRAQIGTLPRLQPRRAYDLAIEIALIRPGPIQGGAVHPYIRRAMGKETVTYPHPILQPVLERTLGVPLFQEQLMQMAIAIGDCTGDEADLLRRAMGSKRGIERIESLEDKLFAGMASHGLTPEESDEIYLKIRSFANFGFAESHALSFSLLVYASSWLKLHYPGAFLAALLRNQPMGFYSPQSLTTDARRHGVEVLRPDIVVSGAQVDLEALDGRGGPTGRDACLDRAQPPVPRFVRGTPDPTPEHRRDGRFAVRLGLDEVQGIGKDVAQRIVDVRAERPFADMSDVARRTGLSVAQMESLATAGAFDAFGVTRRQALWNAGYVESADQLDGTAVVAPPPMLPGMSDVEITMADLWATRISPETHPIEHLRPLLISEGILSVSDIATAEARRRVKVAGLITHRQRPATASGITFLNLEDETGMVNVVCSQALWTRYRVVARSSAGMVIRGILERSPEGVVNLVADKLMRIEEVYPQAARAIPPKHRGRDFQ
ncbi:error-prone DNA polymerase [Aeromicrobium fastidiosum]|uniref:Error-prone DNA polymerase n=1 Tax=Aeromicrobium fastidiosum TaxID=52699 RepID=A0A641AJ85_9ACTN|nr:error-prone DNA polymerase [Aeromicrobium fastidiosum]KAA1372228.1 error-prone DNA polymerase [Aeromicrobium fastidiosum]MBP2391367.1 error-prone DNA polymerase [Aeromicrobium fastidiosum]